MNARNKARRKAKAFREHHEAVAKKFKDVTSGTTEKAPLKSYIGEGNGWLKEEEDEDEGDEIVEGENEERRMIHNNASSWFRETDLYVLLVKASCIEKSQKSSIVRRYCRR